MYIQGPDTMWVGIMWSLTYCLLLEKVPSSQLGRLNYYRLNLVFMLIFSCIFYSLQLFITVHCASNFSIEDELTALIYGLGSNLAADRGVSGQCREIHTDQPDNCKEAREEVNHKVIPCTISL